MSLVMSCVSAEYSSPEQFIPYGPLLTWINLNPSMDK